MKKLLTIVIPTYNMQDYLNRCLDSLIVKPELMEQLEVLVINDGSKDNSSAIAHEYGANYPQTIRVIDKENGNYGSCVNRGLAEAQGKYIKVLDADDWFDTAEFEKYMMALGKVDVDMVLTPYNFVYQYNGSKEIETRDIPVGEALSFKHFSFEKLSYYPMHMVTYRTKMLTDMDYHQTEGVSYTDNEWAFIPQYAIGKFVFYPYVVYQYLIGREGQTMNTDAMIRNAWHLEPIIESMVNNRNKYLLESPGVQEELADKLNLQQIDRTVASLYKMVLLKRKPDEYELSRLQKLDEWLKHNCTPAYDFVSKDRVKAWLPVYYVRYWRRMGKRLPVDWLRDSYRKVRYGNRKM